MLFNELGVGVIVCCCIFIEFLVLVGLLCVVIGIEIDNMNKVRLEDWG